MPRKYRKKVRKTFKKKTSKPRATVPRSLQPKVFKFKRDLEETLLLSGSVAPEGWTFDGSSRVYKNVAWALSSVGDSTDFTNLFKQYKLCAARMKMYFSQTASTDHNNGFSNSQLMVRMAPNERGMSETLNTQYWSSIQAKKYRLGLNGGRPVDIYMPLKIRNEVESSTGTAKTMMAPKWIPNTNTNVIHHGINMAIERVDGQQFSTGNTNNQYVKIITTLYFMTRAVV